MSAPTAAELREGLVEVPAALPTFASEGLEPAARAIAEIAAEAHDYLAGLLDRRPEAQVVVLDEADWATKGRVPLFGLPNASEGSLVVAGTEAPFWGSLAAMVAPEDRAELEAVYATPGGAGNSGAVHGGEIRFGPFFDLVAVHEVAHLFHQDGVTFPRLWLQELFANLALHTWVHERRPSALATLLTLPRLGAKAPDTNYEWRTLEDFERRYSEMGGPNYVWFQFRLELAAEDAYLSGGSAVLRRLFDAFRLDDSTLAGQLRSLDPALGDVLTRF